MFALGHKRTLCDAGAMSALAPIATAKADIRECDPGRGARVGQSPDLLSLMTRSNLSS
jgi:hypothetical protein